VKKGGALGSPTSTMNGHNNNSINHAKIKRLVEIRDRDGKLLGVGVLYNSKVFIRKWWRGISKANSGYTS
jgi:hypothetical protein